MYVRFVGVCALASAPWRLRVDVCAFVGACPLVYEIADACGLRYIFCLCFVGAFAVYTITGDHSKKDLRYTQKN